MQGVWYILGVKPSEKTEPKTLGTVISEEARAKANTFSDEKRRALLERGIALINGGSDHAKTAVGSDNSDGGSRDELLCR